MVLNITIVLAPIGIFVFFLKLSDKRFLLLPWLLSSFYFATAARRFSFLASPAICILAAVPLSLFRFLPRGLRKIRPIAEIATIIVLVSLSAYYTHSIMFSFKPLLTAELAEADTWIGENTPEDAKFFAFWDRATFIEAFGRRATYANSVHQVKDRIEKMSYYFLTDIKLPEPLPDYVVVDLGLILNIAAMQGVTDNTDAIVMTPFVLERVDGNTARFVSQAGRLDIILDEEMPYAVYNNDYLGECLILKKGDHIETYYAHNDMKAQYKNIVYGCVLAESNLAVWASNEALNSNLFKLLVLDGAGTNLTRVFRNGYAQVYEVPEDY